MPHYVFMSVERDISLNVASRLPKAGKVKRGGGWDVRGLKSKEDERRIAVPGFISKKKSLHSSIQTSATRAEFFMTTLTTPPGNE